jgi:DNA (cytosine-5)-methyltransferase 1
MFSGCAGLDLGFERAGFETVWFCEADKWCRKILNNRWPGVPIHEDARELIAEPVDVLIGGFPCQPVSFAGLRNGLDDPKWLWPAYDRAIRQIQPPFVVVENVPGLFRHGFDSVLGDLAFQGYDAQWFSLQSSDVGAPHRRKRVFILATNPRGLRLWKDSREALGEQEEARGTEVDNLSVGSGEGKLSATSIADTISRRFKKRQQGWKLQLIESEHEAPTNPDSAYGYRSVVGWERGRFQFADGYFGPYEEAVRRWANLLGNPPDPKDEKGRLSPYFAEWMMGFPHGWTEGVSRTQRMKMLGNSVQVQCAEVVGNLLKEKIKNE